MGLCPAPNLARLNGPQRPSKLNQREGEEGDTDRWGPTVIETEAGGGTGRRFLAAGDPSDESDGMAAFPTLTCI
jgi:hypothetical protein